MIDWVEWTTISACCERIWLQYNRSENSTLQCRAQRGSTVVVRVVVFYVETAGQATCDSNDFHGHFLLLRIYGSICLSADTEHALLCMIITPSAASGSDDFDSHVSKR